MPRKLKLTKRVIGEIQARRRAGVPYDVLATEFGVSVGSIRNALKAPPQAVVAPSPAESADVGQAGEAGNLDDEAGPGEILEQQARDLRELQKTARTEGNLSAVAVLARVINNTIALEARLKPPPPPDPAAAPDMQAAARACRDKLEAMAAEGRAGSK